MTTASGSYSIGADQDPGWSVPGGSVPGGSGPAGGTKSEIGTDKYFADDQDHVAGPGGNVQAEWQQIMNAYPGIDPDTAYYQALANVEVNSGRPTGTAAPPAGPTTGPATGPTTGPAGPTTGPAGPTTGPATTNTGGAPGEFDRNHVTTTGNPFTTALPPNLGELMNARGYASGPGGVIQTNMANLMRQGYSIEAAYEWAQKNPTAAATTGFIAVPANTPSGNGPTSGGPTQLVTPVKPVPTTTTPVPTTTTPVVPGAKPPAGTTTPTASTDPIQQQLAAGHTMHVALDPTTGQPIIVNENGDYVTGTIFNRAGLDAQTQSTLQINGQQQTATMAQLQATLDANYKTAVLNAKSAADLQAAQIVYQQGSDQLKADIATKGYASAQTIATINAGSAKDVATINQQGARDVASITSRGNVLSTWGQQAGQSPWLARLTGRTPTPGDFGSVEQSGAQWPPKQSASSAALLGDTAGQMQSQSQQTTMGTSPWSGASAGWNGTPGNLGAVQPNAQPQPTSGSGGGEVGRGAADDGMGTSSDQWMSPGGAGQSGPLRGTITDDSPSVMSPGGAGQNGPLRGTITDNSSPTMSPDGPLRGTITDNSSPTMSPGGSPIGSGPAGTPSNPTAAVPWSDSNGGSSVPWQASTAPSASGTTPAASTTPTTPTAATGTAPTASTTPQRGLTWGSLTPEEKSAYLSTYGSIPKGLEAYQADYHVQVPAGGITWANLTPEEQNNYASAYGDAAKGWAAYKADYGIQDQNPTMYPGGNTGGTLPQGTITGPTTGGTTGGTTTPPDNSGWDSGWPAPPTSQQFADAGPFGQAAQRYDLESSGVKWQPYVDAMLAKWRQDNSVANNGMTGWAPGNVSRLGFDLQNPAQRQSMMNQAELFMPDADYLEKQTRMWQPQVARSTIRA